MKAHQLNAIARNENIKMLASALGIEMDVAEELLNQNVLISFNPSYPTDKLLAEQTAQLLERTITNVGFEPSAFPASVEIVIGAAAASGIAPAIFVTSSYPEITITRDASLEAGVSIDVPNAVLSLIVACYISAATLKLLTGDQLPYNLPDPFVLDLDVFDVTPELLSSKIEIDSTYLAGAGAVGNAFLWAIQYFNVYGELQIVDDDVVSDGNLNRQIWFSQADVSHPKAQRLAKLAQPYFPNLKLTPRVARLETLGERDATAWLPKLIVAVDSRRTRRKLQGEMPGEVFDASTTDISEIVLHFNKQPNDLACLCCIYPQDRDELARERHIAESLGVNIEAVQQHHIDEKSAEFIIERFPNLNLTVNGLLGQAYDTLFKALCGQAQLQPQEGRQVLAPFAFVSVLAGTLLAIEFARRTHIAFHYAEYNLWKLSPWQPPQPRLKRKISSLATCEFCGNQILRQTANTLWS